MKSNLRAMLFRMRSWLFFSLAAVPLAVSADQIIYTDSLQNGWQNWSWATVNLANTSPVHSGSDSISVTCSAYSALYFENTAFDPSVYTNFSFWINGGSSGGQNVQVQAVFNGGAVGSGMSLGPLVANTWVHVNAPFSTLIPPGQSAINGLWLQESNGKSLPVFYVDDALLQSGTQPPPPTNQTVTVTVDAAADQHTISPYIYGVAFATSNQLSDMNLPINRSGGNATTRYNWQINATSHAADWYFESIIGNTTNVDGDDDDFVRDSKNGGAQPMLTVPIMGWVAKLGANGAKLASFSVAKYGAQTGTDSQWFPDAGNGVSSATGSDITNNNPTDANIAVGTNFQVGWVQHLTNLWGSASNGGLRFYLMDNEWSIWQQTHRDVHPIGATMDEVLGRFTTNSLMVKGIEPNALVCGPEEWGWDGYLYSGYDQQYGALHGYSSYPDRAAHGNQDFSPWFLAQLKQSSQTAGKRLIDYFTLHCYPQGGEALNDNITAAMQSLRNRSTRSLWDTNYVDESWINSVVSLIPRMHNWVTTNYPGTKIGITEYNWGADDFMNGATAEADILGIFGRESLDLATRWTAPNAGTPAYNAFKMYRNYDGNKSTFGTVNARCVVPNPDELSAFSAVRSSDGALTVMVINKDLTNETPARISITNFNGKATAQVWQMTSAHTNAILRLADVTVTSNVISNGLPPQSITLFIVPASIADTNPPTLHFSGSNLWLNGTPGSKYILQSSGNLQQWTTLGTNTLTSNSFAIPITFSNLTQQYFRTVQSP